MAANETADTVAPTYADDDLLRLREVADVLGLHYFTVAKWARRGEFPPGRKLPNGQWRTRYGDLMSWIAGLPQ